MKLSKLQHSNKKGQKIDIKGTIRELGRYKGNIPLSKLSVCLKTHPFRADKKTP